MADVLDRLTELKRLRGDTFSSYEMWGMIGTAIAEIRDLRLKVKILEAELRVTKKLPAEIDRRTTL